MIVNKVLRLPMFRLEFRRDMVIPIWNHVDGFVLNQGDGISHYQD